MKLKLSRDPISPRESYHGKQIPPTPPHSKAHNWTWVTESGLFIKWQNRVKEAERGKWKWSGSGRYSDQGERHCACWGQTRQSTRLVRCICQGQTGWHHSPWHHSHGMIPELLRSQRTGAVRTCWSPRGRRLSLRHSSPSIYTWEHHGQACTSFMSQGNSD